MDASPSVGVSGCGERTALRPAESALASWLDWVGDLFLQTPSRENLARASNLPDAESLPSGASRAAARRVASLARVVTGDEQARHDLAVDYTQLFCACKENRPYPYESVFADGDHLLMRPVRDDVVRAYGEEGFDCRAVCPTEPEDHIGLELAFSASLLRAGELRALRDFAAAHLVWVADFAAEVVAFAEKDFYPALALLAQELIDDAAACESE